MNDLALDMPTEPLEGTLPTCRCGHDRMHPSVHPERSYGVWAWFLLFMGATGMPKEVAFRCHDCGRIVETSRDPAVRRLHKG